MNFIERLRKEHEQIERELIEMETIIDSVDINYPNLVHVYKKLHNLWNSHETKEEKIFPILRHEKIVIPTKKMLFEHEQIRPHGVAIIEAINSGDDSKTKVALEKHGRIIINKIRAHINSEDEILFRITRENFTDEEMTKAENILNSK